MGSITLGSRVKCSVSGFSGIAIGKAEYLHAEPQILVCADSCKGAECPAERWFDENRLAPAD